MAKKNTATFLGPNKGLSTIGDYAYAFNNAASSTSTQTLLDFTSGNYIFVGTVEFNPEVDYDNQNVGSLAVLRIKMNGGLVGLLTIESTDFFRSSMKLIIPPRTQVTIEVISAASDSTEFITVGLTGRIYDA